MCLTGGTVTDLDGDGQLDLLLAHGESAQQPISVFKVKQVCVSARLFISGLKRLNVRLIIDYPCRQGASNNWLRVIPRTQFGAFARGAKVTVFTAQSGSLTRIIDGGSGYLCEMEPVAHFGLGTILQHATEDVDWKDLN